MAIDTKQMITDKLFGLLTREMPENVTVKRLVEECGISRQTFYYHFKDIIEVMEWGCEQAMRKAFDMSMQAATPKEAITAFIVEVVNNRKAISHLLSSQYSHELSQIMQKSIRAYLWHLFGTMFPNSVLSVADTEVALDFFTGGITGADTQQLYKAGFGHHRPGRPDIPPALRPDERGPRFPDD